MWSSDVRLDGSLAHFRRGSKLNFGHVLILILIVVIAVLYSPVLTSFFNADDFTFLRFLHFDIRQLLDGQDWNEWFVGGVVNYALFRPIGNLYWLLNWV